MVKVIRLFKNDQDLLRKASSGNREAQQEIFEKYSPKMLSVCRQYVKDLQHAEEVLLNGFLKAFTHLRNFKGEGSFEGWLRKIMIRESISFLRCYKKTEFTEDLSLESIDMACNMESRWGVAQIQALIDSLPEGYKMVFILYVVEGYKHAEISKMLKISEGTSKSQLSKARKMLQEKLIKINASAYDTR